MNHLLYTIAIATRNRPDALSLSIPRMLEQSRPPAEIVVVDSSDDHEAVRALVLRLTQASKIPTIVIHGEKGLTRQRNKALEFVNHPIVFFPDDDSIWFKETAELQMSVYERDADNQISAVCGAESPVPPADFKATTASYQMNTKDRIKLRCTRLMRWLESKIAPDPARIAGQSFYRNHTIPGWAQTDTIFPVEWMTGFRMSFRTSIIKKHRFDEALSNYSLFEDIDASFSAWRDGAVVGVSNAKIFHYKSPENRGNGYNLGRTQILNKAYIVSKHTPQKHPARLALIRFSKYKLFQYRTASRDVFGKERLKGALEALPFVKEFTNCNISLTRDLYSKRLNPIKHPLQHINDSAN